MGGKEHYLTCSKPSKPYNWGAATKTSCVAVNSAKVPK